MSVDPDVPSAPAPGESSEPPYYLCDLARASREFALVDRVTGEIVTLPTDREARGLAERRYPGAQFLLASVRSVVAGEDLGMRVVLIVCLACRQEAPGGPWQQVACVTGASHGPRCIPFAMDDVWPDAVNGLATAGAPSVARP